MSGATIICGADKAQELVKQVKMYSAAYSAKYSAA